MSTIEAETGAPLQSSESARPGERPYRLLVWDQGSYLWRCRAFTSEDARDRRADYLRRFGWVVAPFTVQRLPGL